MTLRGLPTEALGNNAVHQGMQLREQRKGDCRANAQASQQPMESINKAVTPTDTPAHFLGNHALSTWVYCNASTDLRLFNRSEELS